MRKRTACCSSGINSHHDTADPLLRTAALQMLPGTPILLLRAGPSGTGRRTA